MSLCGRCLSSLVGVAVSFSAAIAVPAPRLSFAQQLEDAKSLYREGSFQEAISKLLGVVNELKPLRDVEARKPQLADAYLHLGLSYVAVGERAAGKEALKELLRLDRERRLDPEIYAPKVVALFEEAQAEVAAESRSAEAGPRPTDRLAPRKEGRSKTPLILLGVAGAGAGIAAATVGGGATSSAAGTASTIPSMYDVALIGVDPPQGSQLRAGVDNRVTLMFRFDVAAGERVVVTMFLGQGSFFDNRCFNFARTPPFSPGSIPHTEVLTLPAACPLPKTFSVNVLFYKDSMGLQTEGIVLNRVFPNFYTLG